MIDYLVESEYKNNSNTWSTWIRTQGGKSLGGAICSSMNYIDCRCSEGFPRSVDNFTNGLPSFWIKKFNQIMRRDIKDFFTRVLVTILINFLSCFDKTQVN